MKRLLRNALWIAVGATALGLLVWGFLPTPVEVDAGAVDRGDLVVSIDHEGKTRVRNRYEVSSPLAGRLLRIDLRPGDRVEAGKTVLATIEPADPELLDVRARTQAKARVDAAVAGREQAQSELERARALHTQAARELDRAKGLRTRQNLTEQEFETAVFQELSRAAELRAAESAIRIAEFELAQARAALILTRPPSPGADETPRFEIRSPIDGVILRVFQESATVATPGLRLVEVGDPTDLECEVDVLSTDAVKIEPGQRVLFEHWGGPTPLHGRVRVREPAAFTKVSALGVEEQRVNIIIDLLGSPQERAALGDGYRVEARIVTWEGRDIIKAAAGALFRHGPDWAVYRIEDGRAALRTVTLGQGNGLETQVLEGLQPGDRVILHPSDRVTDGVAVEPR